MLAIICDDFAADRQLLMDYCTRYAKEKHLAITAEGIENAGMLLRSHKSRNADVLFLDIYMEGASGIDAAHILRDKGFCGAIVFTTTSQEHYADGFDTDASHYLLKPVSWASFCEAMRRVRARLNLYERTLHVTSERIPLNIAVSGIQYIEVYGHKTILHTSKGEINVSQSLSSLEEALGGAPFLRCYRYFIINMDYVQKIMEDSFLMKDGRTIPISRDRKSQLRSRYMNYIFQKMDGQEL
ncbi:LytR/AlgR family response regulator transcription factor [Dorea sp. D27]|uniref:LytR/AlgR family response regulator transcription factor n=1 Tax=Dorea sp. D27 TaxID=658665 RepID=UPI0006732A2A|nr:LytTR family DNA-binding domain-containing protein [Dorea sp. D27]KMZ55348.1 putative response regulator receiver domain protein [Dorea sp. D27]